MGIISVVAFSFMVHEPSGIMLCARDRSLFSRRFRYLSMSCSFSIELKMGCCMNLEVRANGPTPADTEGARDSAVKGAGLPPFKILNSRSRSLSLVVSSMEMPTVLASIMRKLTSWSRAVRHTAAASPTLRATVSKKGLLCIWWPSFLAPSASTAARPFTRAAMVFKPSGPWYTPYRDEMFASKAWAVQMLEVALSRRICCSRVCMAMRSARRPWASTLTPMMRPGMRRL
mmetsp:Transcript_16705/g.45959  ORF Transcript_16705/g.45959 Transcript_16705/m.45959 type:complete len:230 (+) Transcript_16705:2143-2832(+)